MVTVALAVWALGALVMGIGLHYVGAGPGCRWWKRPIHLVLCVVAGLVWPVWLAAVVWDRR